MLSILLPLTLVIATAVICNAFSLSIPLTSFILSGLCISISLLLRRSSSIRHRKSKNADDIELAFSTRLHAYIGYALLTLSGVLRQIVWTVSLKKSSHRNEAWNSIWWKQFFTQHMYRRIEECWGRPISSAPTSSFKVCIRERPSSGFIGQLLHGFLPFRLTGEQRTCINMASYNYLGFGGVDKDCTPACVEAIKTFGISFGTQRAGYSNGSSSLHLKLEREVADFLGKEDAIVMGMGFATNSTLIPAVVCDEFGSSKKVLILSDELNHKSIVEGCRLSGASIKSFKHSNMENLEQILATETKKGSWAKIFVFVEGVYSMEGGYCKIREVVRLKRKYGCYVWLDEAHSIGGVGPTGRGVTELFNVPTQHIDIMMGTFTKSFGSAGGYIAASRLVIDQVRRLSVGFIDASSMAPVCAQQALSAFQAMQAAPGIKKIRQLRENADYFHKQLVSLGCRVVGDLHAPVVCAMLVHPEKIAAFSTECLARSLAVVVVGFPATPVLLSRVRFCVSASHSKRDLDRVTEILKEVVNVVGIKYAAGEEPLDVEELNRVALAVDLGRDEDKIDYWTPVPIAVESKIVKKAIVSAHSGSIDAAKHDPLGLLARPPPVITAAAIDKLKEVGCGTCGPRGFYGTTTDHLQLEKTIAEFLGTDAAIVYSHHVSTISSVIPAFVKKDDLVLLHADPVATCSLVASGIRLSKAANVSTWTSCEDLEKLLAASASMLGTDPPLTFTSDVLPPDMCIRTDQFRIWIMCEGNQAGLDLKRVVELKRAHHAYLLLDDTLCVGVTGARGRGTFERCGVRVCDVDILIGSLEHAFGSTGGFCAGRADIIEHQRLYGDGYCFSASAPSCLTIAASKAIEFLDTAEGKTRLKSLQANIKSFVRAAGKQVGGKLELISCSSSYAQVIRLPPTVTANEVYARIKSAKTQPVQVSPLGLQLLRMFQPLNFGDHIDQLLQINISSEMTARDVAVIVSELNAALIAPAAPVQKSRPKTTRSGGCARGGLPDPTVVARVVTFGTITDAFTI